METRPALRVPNRPNWKHADVLQLLAAHGLSPERPALVARRGYFRDTMGAPGVNDRGLYDDAIALVSPWAFQTFNANTDPSRSRESMAALEPGTWWYQLGIHGLSRPREQQYRALVQAGDVVVHRDGTDDVAAGVIDVRGRCLGHGRWAGRFGINIHRGGTTTTSSEGCQTIHPTQWPVFFALVESQLVRDQRMRRLSRTESLPYLLLDTEGA